MARKRLTNQLDLNFDGLTDSVTNLVGALILLVVLLIGLTREVTSSSLHTPSPQPRDSQSFEESKTADDLMRRMERLRREIGITERKITQAEERVTQLKQQAEAFLSEATEP